MWRRGNDYEQKGLTDYVAVDGRFRKDICDVKVVRGMFDGSDHLAVMTKLRMKEKWVYEKKGGVKKEVVKIEKLQEKRNKRLSINVKWQRPEVKNRKCKRYNGFSFIPKPVKPLKLRAILNGL